MLPQIQYDKVLIGKMKSNYFNAKALYETIKANAEEIQRKIKRKSLKLVSNCLSLLQVRVQRKEKWSM